MLVSANTCMHFNYNSYSHYILGHYQLQSGQVLGQGANTGLHLQLQNCPCCFFKLIIAFRYNTSGILYDANGSGSYVLLSKNCLRSDIEFDCLISCGNVFHSLITVGKNECS